MSTDDVPQCCRKLCRARAAHAFDAVDSRQALVFAVPGKPRPTRHYELCDEHFNEYLPHGLGYIDRWNATRLRIQCHAR